MGRVQNFFTLFVPTWYQDLEPCLIGVFTLLSQIPVSLVSILHTFTLWLTRIHLELVPKNWKALEKENSAAILYANSLTNTDIPETTKS